MDGIARLCHIVAGGFHAGGRVRSADVEFIDSVRLDKIAERLARQRVALCLDKDIVRHDV